jgi:hypothetical protein
MSAAAIYARYSSDLQREASIEDQTEFAGKEPTGKAGLSMNLTATAAYPERA